MLKGEEGLHFVCVFTHPEVLLPNIFPKLIMNKLLIVAQHCRKTKMSLAEIVHDESQPCLNYL